MHKSGRRARTLWLVTRRRRDVSAYKTWWALSDSNGRPFGCKPNALTAELSAHEMHRTGSMARGQRASSLSVLQRLNGLDQAILSNFHHAVRSLHFLRTASTLICLHSREGNA